MVGAISKSQGTPGKAPPPGPPTGPSAAVWAPTLNRGDGWRPENGAKGHREDHTSGSSREPSRDSPPEKSDAMVQKDGNIKDGGRVRLSPRINKELYEGLDTNVMREYMRVCRMRYENARERLMKAIDMLEGWREQVRMEELQGDVQEHNIWIPIHLLVDRDQERSQ